MFKFKFYYGKERVIVDCKKRRRFYCFITEIADKVNVKNALHFSGYSISASLFCAFFFAKGGEDSKNNSAFLHSIYYPGVTISAITRQKVVKAILEI